MERGQEAHMINELTDEQKEELVLGIHDKDETFENWTENTARRLAQAEEIDLTEAHWSVIRFLRDYYEKHGAVSHARTLTEALEEKFQIQGGLKYLYTLFPAGPVHQGARIAGVPVPGDSANPSFGSVS
jgi:tRNA 2-thiouridine synthesizing protein E